MPKRGHELVGVSAVVPSIFTDADLDLDGIAAVVDHLIAGGVRALAALGVASEPWTLTEPQRLDVVQTVVDAAAGRVPIMVGIAGDCDDAVGQAQAASSAGATHLMVRLPPEAHEQEAARLHLDAIHFATRAPLVLQDVPQLAGGGLSASAIQTIVLSVPSLAAVKVEGLDSGPTVSAIAELPVPVIVGWGGLNLPDRLRRGARGCMPGAGTAPFFVEMVDLWQTDPDAAEARYRRLLPLLTYAGQSLDLMIAATKRILLRLGVVRSAQTVPTEAAPDAVQLATVDDLIEELITEGLLRPRRAEVRTDLAPDVHELAVDDRLDGPA